MSKLCENRVQVTAIKGEENGLLIGSLVCFPYCFVMKMKKDPTQEKDQQVRELRKVTRPQDTQTEETRERRVIHADILVMVTAAALKRSVTGEKLKWKMKDTNMAEKPHTERKKQTLTDTVMVIKAKTLELKQLKTCLMIYISHVPKCFVAWIFCID